MSKISLPRIREIISEELSSAMNETLTDPDAIAKVSHAASSLVKAIRVFKEKANEHMVSAVAAHLDEVERAAENMLSAPGSYVPEPKKEPQKVSFKPGGGKKLV